jgi:hypothetical protein
MYIIMSSITPEITGDQALKLAQQATSATPAVAETPAPESTVDPKVVTLEPKKEDITPPVNQDASVSITKEEFAELNKTVNELKASLAKAPEKQSIQETMSQSNQIVKEIREGGANHFQDAVNTPSAKSVDEDVTLMDIATASVMGGIMKISGQKDETMAQFSQDSHLEMIQSYERRKGRDIIISTQSEYMSSEVMMPGLIQPIAAKIGDTFNIIYQNRAHVEIRAIEDIQTSISDQEYESAEQEVAQIPPAQLVSATFGTKLARFHNHQEQNNVARYRMEIQQGLRTAIEKMDLSTLVSSVFDKNLVGTTSPVQFLNGKYLAKDYTVFNKAFIPVVAIPDKTYFNGIFKANYIPLDMAGSGSLIPDEVAKNKHTIGVVGTRLFAPFTVDGTNEYDFEAIAADDDGLIATKFLKQLADFISQATLRSTMLKVGANPSTQEFKVLLPSRILRMLRRLTVQNGASGASIRKEFVSFDDILRNLVGTTAVRYEVVESELFDRPGHEISDGDVFGVGYYTNSYIVPSYNLNESISTDILESNGLARSYSGNFRTLGSTGFGFQYAHRDNYADFMGKVMTGMFELKHGVNLPLQQFILINGVEPTFS